MEVDFPLHIIDWLLKGDVAIQYQVYRDLLDERRPDLQKRIEQEGWGARFLSKRLTNGHWGRAFYQPKWISTHYTLLDLRHLCLRQDHPEACASAEMIAREEKGPDGGINPAGTILQSDVCVNGMFLYYACWFSCPEELLHSVVDFILEQLVSDGGFNCRFNRSGAVHSSLHSTLSMVEGISEYQKQGYTYRLEELTKAKESSIEFILLHQLFLSDRTGQVINKAFLKLTFPGRWKYDILRALDYFQSASVPYDARMAPALEILEQKRRKDGRWNVQAKHPGQVHFDMEKAGKASRWNTLRALRVKRAYSISRQNDSLN